MKNILRIWDTSKRKPKSESKIQSLINSKTIKHTEFFKKETTNTTSGSSSFVKKYDTKSIKNTTKDLKISSENDDCDFVD